jgi:uncharacterized protein YxjI
MRYVMKTKLFSWGRDFTIRDEEGRDVYFVDGLAFTIGAKLSFQDMTGRELAFIRQRMFAWGLTYEILREGEIAAVVRKKIFTLFRCVFTVDEPGPDDPIAEGDFFGHEYVFTRSGQVIGTVSKKWFSLANTYGVDVADDEDAILLLAATVVIDMACHQNDHHG